MGLAYQKIAVKPLDLSMGRTLRKGIVLMAKKKIKIVVVSQAESDLLQVNDAIRVVNSYMEMALRDLKGLNQRAGLGRLDVDVVNNFNLLSDALLNEVNN